MTFLFKYFYNIVLLIKKKGVHFGLYDEVQKKIGRECFFFLLLLLICHLAGFWWGWTTTHYNPI